MYLKKMFLVLFSCFLLVSCSDFGLDKEIKKEKTEETEANIPNDKKEEKEENKEVAQNKNTPSVALDVIETENAFVAVSEKLQDSIVNIKTKSTVYLNYYNPIEQFLFGESEARTEKKETGSLGSGFVISEDGYVMTNNHVVNGAEEIFVKFADGRELKAEFVGNDPEIDIAILKIESSEKFNPVEFGDSDDIKVGQWAIAFGNPMGLNDTMTVGIISAKGRNSLGIEKIENFIQTDAAINVGNSGGPLVNIQGKVIGINTAIYSKNGGSIGLGFAIPSNLAKNIKESIIKTGTVERPLLGVELQDLNPELMKQFKITNGSGVLVTNVIENSPAEKSELKSGDIIVEINSVKVNSASHLVAQIAAMKVGDTVNIKFIRNEEIKDTKIVLEKRETQVVSQTSFFGMTLAAITPQDAQKYNYSSNVTGLIITNVTPNSEAAKIGITQGMLLKSIDKVPVTNLSEFQKVYNNFKKGDSILLLIMAPNGSQYVTITK